MVPFCTDRSEWQTPEATTFTLTSPAPGGACSMSSWTARSSPMLVSTAALTIVRSPWSDLTRSVTTLSGRAPTGPSSRSSRSAAFTA